MSSQPGPSAPRATGSMPLASRAVTFGLREAGVGVALIVLIIIFSFLSPYFATTSNFTSILAQVSINTILAVGMTFVILIAGIDLSVGSVLALSTVVGAKLLTSDLDLMVSIPLTIAACVGVGTLCGLFNGFVTEWWRVPSFIVTLGMMSIARGSSQVISNNVTITGMPKVFKDFGNWQIFDLVPVYFIIALVVVFIAWFVLRFTIFGRFIYAIGNNEEAVRLSGHNPMPFKISAFLICGLLAGLAGLVFLLRLKAGSPIAAVGWELTAIAAVIIGGTSFAGGKGSVIGTFFGVCLLQVLGTGLILVGVEDNVRTIIIGLVVVAAAVFDTYRSRIIAGLRAR